MEVDGHNNHNNATNGGAQSKLWNLTPVAAEQTGKGLPYAPENWPKNGDLWGWRTGRRVASNGHFVDRYLYLPTRLRHTANQGSSQKQKAGFASKLSVERYVKEFFPNVDIDDFFASFSWKIPALHSGNAEPIATVPIQQLASAEQSETDSPSDFVGCKAGNQMCISLILEKEKYLPAMPCDICCVEHGFCGDCCCILCCRTVNSAYGGYSYIKCEIKIGDYICGHVAHMECALRAYMGGTVGGSIGLDVEYYCRRCDRRTDLIPHVNKLLQTCEAIDLEDDIKEKILKLGFCLLRGSQKAIAKELIGQIKMAISKLNCRTNPEDTGDVDGNPTAHSAGFSDNGNAAKDVTVNERPYFEFGTESVGNLSDQLRVEIEVMQVLEALRRSQQFEYNLAEERLHTQKNYLKNLYQQLEIEKSDLACQQHSSDSDAFSRAVTEREEQIMQEEMKFEDMKKVGNGFGRTSKDILKEHFDIENRRLK